MQALHTTKLAAKRIVSIFAFVCMLAATASAYTIVMYGGRRVEIPASFIVAASTLTYEVSAGVQVTINVAAIDVTATEKANNEAPGSFLRRALTESRSRVEELSTRPVARRTITNRDLEASSQRRQASELAYERRRKELGLPSVAESRRQAEIESASLGGELEAASAEKTELESYWRARASALRTEIASVDAQLRYVRGQLDEPSFPSANGSFTTVVNVGPFPSLGPFGRGRFNGPIAPRPGVFIAPRSVQGSLRIVVGDGRRGQVIPNPAEFPRVRPFGSPLLAAPNLTSFGSTWPAYAYSYERSQLITQFNQLAAARAGLNARWRELEDEARRAGAPPGWLRP